MTDQPKIVQPKLASAFSGGAAPDRSASLTGILSKRSAATAPPSPAEIHSETAEKAPQSAQAPQTGDATRDASQRPRRASKRASGTRSASVDETVLDVGVYLDPDVVQQLRAKRREGIKPGQPERTYDELLVDALVKVTEDQLARAFAVDASSAADGVPRRIRRPKGTGTNLIQHRLTAEQRGYLDQLADRTGAPSRSALVNTVYKLAYSR